MCGEGEGGAQVGEEQTGNAGAERGWGVGYAFP